MPPDPTIVVTFDPHVTWAIVAIALALVAVVLAFAFGLAADEEERRWKS
jgi:hypothetical protein